MDFYGNLGWVSLANAFPTGTKPLTWNELIRQKG